MSRTWETGTAARSAPALQLEEGLRTGEQHFLCLFQIPSEGVGAVPPPWRQLQFRGPSHAIRTGGGSNCSSILLETNSSAFVMLISVLVNFRCFHWVWNLG